MSLDRQAGIVFARVTLIKYIHPLPPSRGDALIDMMEEAATNTQLKRLDMVYNLSSKRMNLHYFINILCALRFEPSPHLTLEIDSATRSLYLYGEIERSDYLNRYGAHCAVSCST